MRYPDFITSKRQFAAPVGFDIHPSLVHPGLFSHQADVTLWSLRQGRAALFLDTGLGKTRAALEWARHVAMRTDGRVLILAPLAVAHQFIAEGQAIDLDVVYARNQADADVFDKCRVVIANYEMLDRFDPTRWSGVTLDESSLLANYTGKTKQALIAAFAETPYKLCCTATPAPNDWVELGNHAEFLGIMSSGEMLTRFFHRDSNKAGHLSLKGHAEKDFWRWMASWAVMVSRPSDLGYSDDGYDLPPLHIHQHDVAVDHSRAWANGEMFLSGKLSATNLHTEKRATREQRCQMADDIATEHNGEPLIIWCDTDAESKRITALLPRAVEVRGSMPLHTKEERLRGFSEGKYRVIVTKTSIAGYGLNWQHCSRQVFVGLNFSFQRLYQGMRRSWRFGQQYPVHIHLIVAETEGNVLANIERKQEQHRTMQEQMTAAMCETGLLAQRSHLVPDDYKPAQMMQFPQWMKGRAAA